MLVPGWTAERCGCGGDGPSEGLPKSNWSVDSVLVVQVARGRRANSFRNFRNEFKMDLPEQNETS